MGYMGRYIDSLSDSAKDRVIEAQDWGIADVVHPDGSRCLVGHAEDWRPMESEGDWWQRWRSEPEAPCTDPPGVTAVSAEFDVERLCHPQLFAFRRARPADLSVYRDRIRRLGLSSESRIGARFDRLCARRGGATAIRLIKQRASRAPQPRDGSPIELSPVASVRSGRLAGS